MHTVFALLCFVVAIHWLIFPYPSGLLHWHCGNLTIAPVPAKQPWWIWINTSCEFIMNDCITTTKQSTTKPCAYFLGYTVVVWPCRCVGWHDTVIHSCLVSNVDFGFTVQASLYHDMDISNMWHGALVSCTPSQSIGLVFGCPLFWCWVLLCVPSTNSLIELYLSGGILWPLLLFSTRCLGFL